MYRAIAWKARQERISLTDKKALAALARRFPVTFRVDPGRIFRVLIDGQDVTEKIRHPQVSRAASQAAVVPAVREILVRQQRKIGFIGRVVAEGRDTGTVVFPKADLKFFLTASAAQRAKRRLKDLRLAGHKPDLPQVLEEMKERDARDRGREVSPLRRARGAVVIDNTRLQFPQVIDKMLFYVRRLNRRR